MNQLINDSNGNTKKFNKILTCFDRKQHVNFPTHVHGNSLDLLINKRIPNSIKSVFSAAGISDHLAVISEIDCWKKKWNKEKISFPKINKIDYESFHSDILNSDLIKKPEKDLSALCQQYNSVLSSILDKHAPVSTKTQKTTNSMDDFGNNKGLNPSPQSRTNMEQISLTSRSFSLQTSMPPV